jgi:hypothetical protein
MRHHYMYSPPARHEEPQEPSSRPKLSFLYKILHPTFGEKPFHALR